MEEESRVSPYWSSVCVTSSQVFLAVAVAYIFTGGIDFDRGLVIILNLLLTVFCWQVGWGLNND